MKIEEKLTQAILAGFENKFGQKIPSNKIILQTTRKEFEGDFTFVTFPFGRITKKRPEETAQILGDYLQENIEWITKFNVVKGFLNISISSHLWIELLSTISSTDYFRSLPRNGEKVMVEYSSPNTNKPLHLGHLRNNFLGHSVSLILEAAGYEVLKANLVNDRGIHICKSMLAYQKFGHDETPEEDNIKGDKLVGDYYVKFDLENRKQTVELQEQIKAQNPKISKEDLAKKSKNTPLLLEAQEMLQKWENNDPQTVALWKKMNGWVYTGFDETYQSIGVEFDKFYYESGTYLLGKQIVQEGLEKGIFFQKPDSSVWINLKSDKLDEKLLLRPDGTSVYMTQDMGTADLKYRDFSMQKSVYVVGNEQDYHFKVLRLIMQKLNRPYADGIFHLSYGMVELPEGKMKSREGKVVDADDLVAEMVAIATERTNEAGKIENFTEKERQKLYHQLALGALKYYLLKVEPKKKMLFNPKESIDFQGDTGVYIQYTHARCCSILRRAEALSIDYINFSSLTTLEPLEIDLIRLIADFPIKLQEAAENYSPAVMANYAYDVARLYGKFFAELSIFNAENPASKALRIQISLQVAETIRVVLQLIGVEAPKRM